MLIDKNFFNIDGRNTVSKTISNTFGNAFSSLKKGSVNTQRNTQVTQRSPRGCISCGGK